MRRSSSSDVRGAGLQQAAEKDSLDGGCRMPNVENRPNPASLMLHAPCRVPFFITLLALLTDVMQR
jgi:hypothetical protein